MDGEEKVFKGYEWAYQRIHQYDHLIANRTNSFLFSSSILFTGFVLLFMQFDNEYKWLIFAIPVVGLVFSFFNVFNQIRGVRELRYWKSVCLSIEKDEDYFSPLRRRDLVFIGHEKWIHGEENKYTSENKRPKYKSTPLGTLERFFLFKINVFHEWITFQFILPLAFFGLWVVALIFTLGHS